MGVYWIKVAYLLPRENLRTDCTIAVLRLAWELPDPFTVPGVGAIAETTLRFLNVNVKREESLPA